MSKATKRKHVTKEVLDAYVLPDVDKQIVKVQGSHGNNLHEVETPNGETFLVSMPTKFRKNIWIKRGDFVLVTPIEEGDKVKAEITHILYKEQIKYIKEEKLWPPQFTDQANDDASKHSLIPDDMLPPSDDDDEDDEYSDSDNEQQAAVVNPNHQVRFGPSSDYSSEEEDR